TCALPICPPRRTRNCKRRIARLKSGKRSRRGEGCPPAGAMRSREGFSTWSQECPVAIRAPAADAGPRGIEEAVMGVGIEGARILVAGGGSLVGSHLAAALMARGVGEIVVYDPIAFDPQDALGDLKADPRVTMVRGDLMKLHQVIEHMDGVDGAVNLAAYMTLGLSQTPIDAIDVNVRGHANFLEAARIRGVQKVIFASSNAVYGYGIGGGIAEDEPHHNAGIPAAAAAYGATKILGEQLCRIYKQKHGLDYVVLRFSTVY